MCCPVLFAGHSLFLCRVANSDQCLCLSACFTHCNLAHALVKRHTLCMCVPLRVCVVMQALVWWVLTCCRVLARSCGCS